MNSGLDFHFFGFAGAGVRSIARSASSNLTPLRFSVGPLGGVFLGAFLFFTVAFPSSTIANYPGFYKAIMLPGQPRHSNGLAIRQALTLGHCHGLLESLAIACVAVIPTESELAAILRQVMLADMVEAAVNAPLYQAEK